MVARRRSASKALLVLGDIACQVACQAVEAGLAGWGGGIRTSDPESIPLVYAPIHLKSGEFLRLFKRL